MKSWAGSAVLATLVVAVAAQSLIARADAQDLRNAVPADMFLAVYGKHNPERDYQKQHYQEVWKAVEQTRIVERVVQLAQRRRARVRAYFGAWPFARKIVRLSRHFLLHGVGHQARRQTAAGL